MNGTVYLVGAGPGAVDLLTLRAVRLLGQADLVLHDALVSAEVLALAGSARLLAVGKRAGRASTDQGFLNRLLVRAARQYRCVVRLKGGDPLLFGRAQEEIDACRAAGIAVEVVPGITAGFAAAAALLTSVSQRGLARSVSFVTPAVGAGMTASDDWAVAAAAADSCVVYMGKADAARVRAALLARGLAPDTPAILAESVSCRGQRTLAGTLGTLPALAAEAGDGPALLLIGAAFAKAQVDQAILEASVRSA